MGIPTITQDSMKLIIISLAILAFVAGAHAQDEYDNNPVMDLLDSDVEANPDDEVEDALEAKENTDAKAQWGSTGKKIANALLNAIHRRRRHVTKECAATSKWHIEADCQKDMGACWVRVKDFQEKFGTCNKFCAKVGKACIDAAEEKEDRHGDLCVPDGVTDFGKDPCNYRRRSSDALCRCSSDKQTRPMVLDMHKWYCGKHTAKRANEGWGNCKQHDCDWQCKKGRGYGWCKKSSWSGDSSRKCTLSH